ncbi:hypothetical protein ACIRD3_35730 [Kitasatospora sp. NPDC093550]|uniref:hypothetical protein n=1 Tax=Kitasatospora sp. NPDC093550 TaxID=3364089 RepID=UPI0037FEDB6B
MSARPKPGRIVLAVLCFLLGVLVGGCALYLLEHLAEIGQPIYLGIFAAAALTTLGVADRLVNHRAPPQDSRRSGASRSG